VATVYVYFKVAATDAQDCAAALAGLGCEVSRRVDVRDGLVTMMERYTLTGAPSSQWLQQMHQRAQALIATWLRGERHTEVFVELNKPA
jgi:hypothetical protein